MDTTEPLATIEKRIARLERKICSGVPLNKDQKCVEDILNVHNRLQSAVTGREKITSVFSKLDDLERYLNPSFKDSTLLTESAKVNLILLEEDRIRNVVDALQTIKDLQQYLDSEHIRAAPSLFPKLTNLSQVHLELEDQASHLTQEARNMIAAYDEIITTLSKMFIQWDSLLTEIEESRSKKPVS